MFKYLLNWIVDFVILLYFLFFFIYCIIKYNISYYISIKSIIKFLIRPITKRFFPEKPPRKPIRTLEEYGKFLEEYHRQKQIKKHPVIVWFWFFYDWTRWIILFTWLIILSISLIIYAIVVYWWEEEYYPRINSFLLLYINLRIWIRNFIKSILGCKYLFFYIKLITGFIFFRVSVLICRLKIKSYIVYFIAYHNICYIYNIIHHYYFYHNFININEDFYLLPIQDYLFYFNLLLNSGLFLFIILIWIIFYLLFIIFFIDKFDIKKLRFLGVLFFNVLWFYFFVLYCLSYKSYFLYYYEVNFFYLNIFNFNLAFALDNISLLFILLTCFLFLITILVSLYNIKYNLKLFILLLIILEFFLILTFLSVNFFLFYLFFELSLIPMFLIIGMWGSRQRKLYAVYQFLFYTLLGSIFILSALFLLYSTYKTLDIQIIMNSRISFERQLLIWLLLFIGFSTKIPLVPFHVWLPEAHVEAPTSGSIILAGILSKLGTYGILRFLLIISPFSNYFYLPFIYTLCVISIIYISFIILAQIDLKKIIAYSSILHMNFIILGLFSLNLNGLMGSIFLMVSHGLISSGLFICIGILYDRYKTRNLLYYGGIVEYMPLFSIYFFILILANMSFPFTSNFIGEILVCLGLVENNLFLTFLIILSTFLNSIYSVWLFNRIVFGFNKNLKQVSDLSEREFVVLNFLTLFIIILGIQPHIIIDFIQFEIYWLLEYLTY